MKLFNVWQFLLVAAVFVPLERLFALRREQRILRSKWTLDLVYTFVFIPGLILACFGIFYIAGPLTLAVLPLTILWNGVIYRIQGGMYRREGLKVRRNAAGFLFYSLAYSLLMQPVCVWGYVVEILGMRKQWGTK